MSQYQEITAVIAGDVSRTTELVNKTTGEMFGVQVKLTDGTDSTFVRISAEAYKAHPIEVGDRVNWLVRFAAWSRDGRFGVQAEYVAQSPVVLAAVAA